MAPPPSSEPVDQSALRNPDFRAVWLASIVANFGTMVLMVGAGWTMATIDGRADRIAAVQSAILGPVLVFAMLGGTLADILDRRRTAIVALLLGLTGSITLVAAAAAHRLSAELLLLCCFIIGSGNALFSPAWQTSVAELVTKPQLPRAILLNSASYNLARSAGPALGGLIVAGAGALAAFIFNSLSFVPMLFAFLRWRPPVGSRPEPKTPLLAAYAAGVRYAVLDPWLRRTLGRAAMVGLFASVLPALAPIIARDRLGGGATVYGIMLAAFGLGAVTSVTNIHRLRTLWSMDVALITTALAGAAGTAIVAASSWQSTSAAGFFLAGAAYNGALALINIAIQTETPRWIAARTLAALQSVVAGGVAIGSLGWGIAARHLGIGPAVTGLALALAFSGLVGRLVPLDPRPERA